MLDLFRSLRFRDVRLELTRRSRSDERLELDDGDERRALSCLCRLASRASCTCALGVRRSDLRLACFSDLREHSFSGGRSRFSVSDADDDERLYDPP